MKILLIPPKNLTDRILYTDPSAPSAEKNYQSDTYREIRLCLGNAIDNYVATSESISVHVRTVTFITRLAREHTAGTIEFIDPVDIAKQVAQVVERETEAKDWRNWDADREFKIRIKHAVRECEIAVSHRAYDSYDLDMLYFSHKVLNPMDIHPIEKLTVENLHSICYVRTFYV